MANRGGWADGGQRLRPRLTRYAGSAIITEVRWRTLRVLIAEDMRGLVELAANGVFKRLSSAAQHEWAMRHENVLDREAGQAAKHGT